jgi:ABC-type dipeptide/oligopeptide/nickel transport system permease subunit
MVSENRGGIALNPYAVLAPAALLGLLTIGINLVSDEMSGRKQ